MSRAGFHLSDDLHDCPDHIAVELECMAHLCQAEENARKEKISSENICAIQSDLITNHFTKWLYLFCADIRQNAKTQYWKIISNILARFLRWESLKFTKELLPS
jgi:TorA maturation chaperone TorD